MILSATNQYGTGTATLTLTIQAGPALTVTGFSAVSGIALDNVLFGVRTNVPARATFSSAIDSASLANRVTVDRECPGGVSPCAPGPVAVNVTYTIVVGVPTVSIMPTAGDWQPNAAYRATLLPGITDVSGLLSTVSASTLRFVTSPPANQAASIQTPLDTTQIAVIQMPSGALPSGGFITPRTRFINPASPLTANASALNITNQGGLQVFNRAEVGIFPCPPNDPIFNCPPGTGPGAASVPVTLTMRPATPWVLSLMDQSTLGIYTLGTGGLVPVPNSTVNANGTVSAPITQSALYFLAGAHHTRLDSSYASPVPYKPALGHTVITFRELAVDSIIKIYTIMGELVKEIHPAPGADEITWDVKNSDGETVASGVYIYQIKNPFSEKRGKLVIVR